MLKAASKILSSPQVAQYTELLAILSGPPLAAPAPQLPPPPAPSTPSVADWTRCSKCGATGKHGSSQTYPKSFHCPTCIEEIDNPECEGCGEKFGFGVCEFACCRGHLCPGCKDEITPKCGSCQESKCSGCGGEDGVEMEVSSSLGKVCSDCIVYTDGEKCGSCEQRHMECEEDDCLGWLCPGCIFDCAGEKCGSWERREHDCERGDSVGWLRSDCIVYVKGNKCRSCGDRSLEEEGMKYSYAPRGGGSVCVDCYELDVDCRKCNGCSENFDNESGDLGLCLSQGQYGSISCASCLCSEEDACQQCQARQPRKRQGVEVE
ncbi:hypothetical protein TrLO_g4329 [Triparma laevis f. longispina]|uniref:Uncharacterized protein n=1 Tax=Triparma laevis f. longispina TaxID=1714387 RepID=A0A9W7KX71_9STRA|nr:hypothetical protein TrLO_g4329 [Triparma laevis f. longispina]